MSIDDLSEPVKEAVRTSLQAFSEQHLERLVENYFRCRALVDLHVRLMTTFERDAPAVQDVLRSAVVLLHASVEDMLRTAAIGLIPTGPAEALNGIYWPSDRPKERANVAVLAEHRGRSVDEVLAICVAEHFSRQTFNNAGDVMALVEQVGLNLEQQDALRPFLGQIDAMMRRRHQIVHRADRDPDSKIATIAVEDVVGWLDAVQAFGRIFFIHASAQPVIRAALAADAAARGQLTPE